MHEPTITPSAIRVAVAGATGYAGQELLRILARHPGVSLTLATSSGSSERRSIPALAKIWDAEVHPLDEQALLDASDVVCMALPEKTSATLGAALVAAGKRVVDLSGAFRVRDEAARLKWYPETRAVPDGTIYALPERSRAAVAGATLVSCPGCYPPLPCSACCRSSMPDCSRVT